MRIKLLFPIEKGTYVLLGLFIIPMLMDFWSTIQAGEFVQHLEVNPLYNSIGLLGIILLNFLIVYFITRQYSLGTSNARFGMISLVVWLAFVRLYTFWNNMKVSEQIQSGELTLETAAAIPEETKIIYAGVLAAAILLPWFINNISFWLFKIDNKIERK